MRYEVIEGRRWKIVRLPDHREGEYPSVNGNENAPLPTDATEVEVPRGNLPFGRYVGPNGRSAGGS